MKVLEKKVALVTGAGSGIGRASAMALAAEGAHVAVTDINGDAGRETVELIVDSGGQASFYLLDVADVQKVGKSIALIAEELGGLQVAVNNAGIEGPQGRLAEISMDDVARVLQVNVLGVAACMQAELKVMGPTGGSIINISSAMGLIGGHNLPAYAAAKHAVVGLTKASAMDYADDGIRINGIAPGAIDTGFSQLSKAQGAHLLRDTPLGRAGQAEEVAQAVVWLASDRSSYVTGHTLPVDGGVVIGSTATKMEGVA